MKDMTDRLARIDERLAALNARSGELKEQLDSRTDERDDLVRNQIAELSAFDTETDTIKARRAEVKTDYGILFEAAGALRKAAEALQAKRDAGDDAQTHTE